MNGTSAGAQTREESVVEQVYESAWWPGESVDYSQIGSMVALALAAAAVVVSLAKAEWPAAEQATRPAVSADARATLR